MIRLMQGKSAKMRSVFTVMEYLDAFRPLHSDDVAPSLLADLVWPWPALVAGATALSLADGHRPSPGAPGHAVDETSGADRPPQPGAGIIIIDFIDMEDEEHQRQVLRTLEKQLERDHAKTNIIGITELGLVQMTRKRTRESLEQVLCEPCVCCQGRGKLKTAETICYEIFREILREARAYQAVGYRVLANQKVVDRLLDEESGNVAELEGFIGRTIRFQVETMYSQEQYDVVLL